MLNRAVRWAAAAAVRQQILEHGEIPQAPATRSDRWHFTANDQLMDAGFPSVSMPPGAAASMPNQLRQDPFGSHTLFMKLVLGLELS